MLVTLRGLKLSISNNLNQLSKASAAHINPRCVSKELKFISSDYNS